MNKNQDVIPFQIIVDTNVAFEGLTKQSGAAGLIIHAWSEGLICPCFSNALVFEYIEVLSHKLVVYEIWRYARIWPTNSDSCWLNIQLSYTTHKLSEPRWEEVKPILRALLDQGEFVNIYYSWRPTSPDPGDDHLIDCAMNANVPIVTYNIRDFQSASEYLGLKVMKPIEFVSYLSEYI